MSHMTAKPLLEMSHVSHSFDGTSVFTDLSLHLSPGECLAIVGPSGCGKSTLLRLVAGLDTPSSGKIANNASNLQMIFQEATLLPWRTLRENVQLPAHLSGTTEHTDTTTDLIASVGLSGHEEKYPHQLSGGMKMRGALARALSTNADLYLFDEPFSAIDEITREALQDLFLTVRRDRNFTSMFVTHNIGEAVYVADRVMVMTNTSGTQKTACTFIDVPIPIIDRIEMRFSPTMNELCRVIHSELEMTSS